MAAILAAQGRDVVLLEKARHPRFHIGESLLPSNLDLFERLGVLPEVERIGMPKYGIEFISPDHDHHSFLEFADQFDKSRPYAWQVRRSELDELLFRHAQAKGARGVEGCRVGHVHFETLAEGGGVVVEGRLDDGQTKRWRARYLVDASGRDTFLAQRLGLKRKNPRHNSSALFAHYTNAQRLEGRLEGNITLMWFEHGWFWFIPLADGTTSIGAVCWPYYLKSRSKPMREFWDDTIAMCPELAERLKDATLVGGTVHATGNYSYDCRQATGDRFVLLGDAFTFIDPMFSSGVYLAMHNAFEGARLVATALDEPARAAQARRSYEAIVRKGPREFSWFVVRATNNTIREMFMHPRNPFRVKEALLSLLAGDLYGKSRIQPSLWMLKLIYYFVSLQHLPRTIRSWRRRGRNIADVGPLAGENVLEG
jgi:2-polyprenyl-6-methoxyphenol hydroxylase-like FAD-dependent oxidoreductase